jgi:acetylornithine deacetylase/succinyl-diaminopimelate desuccinylase-like protein
MHESGIKKLLDARISRARAKELLIELVKVPSPQTELLEDEPLLKTFIRTAVEPRLRAMGFADIRHDTMGNLIATYGAGTSGRSLMFIGNAMNQPASTMPNPYSGDVVDGARYGLPGECVMGKGASEQKANLAAMLHAMETVIASGIGSSSPAACRGRPASTTPSGAWSRVPACAPTWRCWAGPASWSRSATAAASTCS